MRCKDVGVTPIKGKGGPTWTMRGGDHEGGVRLKKERDAKKQ
jgi:hypothetical protein